MLDGVRRRGRTVRPPRVVVVRPSERDEEGDSVLAEGDFGAANDGGLKERRLKRLRKDEGESEAAGAAGAWEVAEIVGERAGVVGGVARSMGSSMARPMRSTPRLRNLATF